MLLQMANSSLFLWLCNILYIYIVLNQLSDDGLLSFFHVLAIVNSVAVNIGVHVSFQIKSFIFSGYMSRYGIAR